MATPAHIHTNPADDTNVTSLNVAIPSAGQGAAADDFALLGATVAPGTISDPAGWTLLPGFPLGPTQSSGRLYVWSKTLVLGDLGTNVSLSISTSSRVAAACTATDPATVDTIGLDSTGTAAALVTAPSIDPGVTDALLVCYHGALGHTNGDPVTWTPPTGMTERADVDSASGSTRNATLLVSTEALASGNPTGTRVATASVNVQRLAASIALRSNQATTVVAAETAEATAEAVFEAAGSSISLTLEAVGAVEGAASLDDATATVPPQDDEFNAAAVNTRWTEVDPAGDCTVTTSGG